MAPRQILRHTHSVAIGEFFVLCPASSLDKMNIQMTGHKEFEDLVCVHYACGDKDYI